VGSVVDTLLAAGVSHYMDFKAVHRTYCFLAGDTCPRPVPVSRSDIFTDKSLSVFDKRAATKFITDCITPPPADDPRLQVPLETALRNDYRMSDALAAMVRFAWVGLADDSPVTLADAISRTRTSALAIGRYGNQSPYLAPFHGPGELAQAFSRHCAVFGGVYMLRRSVVAVQLAEEAGYAAGLPSVVAGVELDGAQRISCSRVLLSPEVVMHSPTGYLACAIYIVSSPVLTAGDTTSYSVCVFPPLSVLSDHAHAMYAAEQSAAMQVCPPGFAIVHVWTRVSALQVKQSHADGHSADSRRWTDAAACKLFKVVAGDGGAAPADGEALPATMLWAAGYFVAEFDVPDQAMAALPSGVYCARSTAWAADLTLDRAVDEARSLFARIYPDKKFFPAAEPAQSDESATVDEQTGNVAAETDGGSAPTAVVAETDGCSAPTAAAEVTVPSASDSRESAPAPEVEVAVGDEMTQVPSLAT
jgi:hypothetical protein